MKHAQGLSVVALFGHHKDYAAKAKALRPMHIGRPVLPAPDTIATAMIDNFSLHFSVAGFARDLTDLTLCVSGT